jgi:twitching motility protein PilT
LPYDSDTFEIAVLPQSTPEIIEISSEDTLRGLLAAERVLAGSQDSESFPTPISNTLDERPSMSRNNEPPTTPSHSLTEAEEASAVVVPLTRSMRVETGPRGLSPRPGSVARLLRLASSRGASALYLPSQARPYIRAYGDIRVLEEETVLTSEDVEAAVMELAPESARDAVRRGTATEWALELDDLGRILCTTFRDFRGPGALFQMISAKAASADQLGLSRDMQALSTESEGLVVVAGPRASGKSTLIAAFMDLVNRSRSDYVITLERQIRLVHDNRSSTVSQREIRGSSEEVVAQARLAMRENPDVLVIEDIRSPEVLQVALDAAGSGVLVFISVTAPSAAAAVERLLDMVPVERRGPVQALLSETLRGVVSQVLLRKTGGGRVAARELMLATGEVTGLVSEGQAGQLPQAIEHGRKHGMVPLNDALVAFVQSGAVDVREAYRKAADRPGLVALLKREGIDTSFVERLA